MLLDSNDEIFENAGIKKLKPKKSQLEKQKIRIFKLFGKIFKSNFMNHYQIKSQIMVEAALNAIVTVQMVALAWYPDINIARWDHYSSFWKFISYFNINNFCAISSITDYCFYGTFSVLGYCSGTLLIVFLLGFTKIRIPKFFIWILRTLLSIWATVLFIPSMLELAMIFKYSAFNCDKIDEWTDSKNPSLMNYGPAGAFLSVLYIIFLFLIATFWDLFSADIRHTFGEKNLTARAHSSVDLMLLVFRTTLSISYVLFGNLGVVKYQIIFLIGSLCIYLQFLVRLPYFNKIANCISSCKIFSVSLAFLAILLATIIDDSGIAFMLNLFMQPVAIVINIWIVNKRTNITLNSKIDFSNQYRFEQTIRRLLCDKNLENKMQVIDYFVACFDIKKMVKDKLLIVWEVNFCSYSIRDERLARIKLSRINKAIFTIEGCIQEWKTQKNIDKKDRSSIDAHYLRYLEDLNKVRQMDNEICFELIDLWSEFADKIPEYSRIYHLSMKSSYQLANLKEFYEKLVLKYKHIELYDLYITFLENVLGETEQTNPIYRLKTSISRQASFSSTSDSKFGSEENCGIMLVSANDDSFEIITYANEKASQILKGTMSDLIGSHLHYFIPEPYAYNHESYMKEYVQKYKAQEITHRGWFFLQNSLGNLIECGVSIKLTAFHNNIYFLVNLTPRITNRQFALISEIGLVYSCTELFSYYIGVNQRSAKNCYISDIIPGLDITSMTLFEPTLIRQKGQKFAIIHAITELGATTLHKIIVAHDEKEINLWKKGQEIDQIEYFEKIHISAIEDEKINHESYLKVPESTPNVRFQKAIAFSSLDNEKSEEKETECRALLEDSIRENQNQLDNNEEKSVSNLQGSSMASSSTSVANKNIETLTVKLRLFQRILLFCILAVIASNIAVLAYIYQVSSHSSHLNVFSHMGNLMFHLVYTADLARSIDSEKKSGIYNLTRDFAYLNSTVIELKNLRNYILDDYDEWSYCDSSSIVVKEEIPVWIFDPTPHIEKFNFYDEVGLFIKHGDNLIDLISKNLTYTNTDVKFFGINCFGLTFKITQKAMQGLVDCEVHRVTDIKNQVASWIFFGLGLLALFVALLIGYVIYMTKKYDEFWNFIKKVLHRSYLDLKATYIERLSKIHGIDYESDQNQDRHRSKRQSKKIKTRVYLKYIWRLSIFLIIASCYFFILKFYLYEQCENYLVNRPRLLLNLISKRTQLTRMSVFARDLASNSILRWVPNSYAVANSRTEFTQSNNEFKRLNTEIREKKFLDLVTDDMKKRIFEVWDTNNDHIQQGTYAASNLMHIDSKFISTAEPGAANIIQFGYYIGNETAVQDVLGVDYEIIDKDSKDVINSQLNVLIFVAAIFSSALILLFIFFYLPFIYKEKTVLVNLKVLISIIPSSRVDLKGEKWD